MVDIYPILDRTWPSDGLGPVRDLMAQIPDPASLGAGAPIALHAMARAGTGSLTRWFGKPRHAHLAVRCSALLACGYREVCAEIDPATGEVLACAVAP